MTGEILDGQKEIDTVISNPYSKLLHSEIFSHYTASGVAGFGVLYNVPDEIKAYRAAEATFGKLAIGLFIVIPTAYIGYAASDFFKLECSSQGTYDRLKSPGIWNIQKLNAAKALFDEFKYCIDRNATLPDDVSVDKWRSYIAAVNHGVPRPHIIENKPISGGDGLYTNPVDELFAKTNDLLNRGLRIQRAKVEITWGDKFYRRIYGTSAYETEGISITNSVFDNVDFQIIDTIEQNCQKIDVDVARQLYAQIPVLGQYDEISNFLNFRRRMISSIVNSHK
jgi:hypothetical protein